MWLHRLGEPVVRYGRLRVGSTACPANCTHIVAGDRSDDTIDRYPVSFEIDLLVSIYRGFCEEACL